MRERIKRQNQINVTLETLAGEANVPEELVIFYATRAWAGSWQEFLRFPGGKLGAINPDTGEIYPKTKQLLLANNIDIEELGPDWDLCVYEMATRGELIDPATKNPIAPYWTMESAKQTLVNFLASPYFGEILTSRTSARKLIGFTAYTVGSSELAQKRFPYSKLIVDNKTLPTTTDQLLNTLYPEIQNWGIFLDFAITPEFRGQGLSKTLFARRLNRLKGLGAEAIIGRTIKTSPAQWRNYTRVGLRPIAFDPEDLNEALFTCKVNELLC